jgi:hypothetical protein
MPLTEIELAYFNLFNLKYSIHLFHGLLLQKNTLTHTHSRFLQLMTTEKPLGLSQGTIFL